MTAHELAVTEDVTLVVGSYTFELPAGSFGTAPDGAFVFTGTNSGVRLSIRIKPSRRAWSIKANGKPVSGLTSSSPVSLRIGNDVTP